MKINTTSLVVGGVCGALATLLLAMVPAPQHSVPAVTGDSGRYQIVSVEPGEPGAARILRIDTTTGEIMHLVWNKKEPSHYEVRP